MKPRQLSSEHSSDKDNQPGLFDSEVYKNNKPLVLPAGYSREDFNNIKVLNFDLTPIDFTTTPLEEVNFAATSTAKKQSTNARIDNAKTVDELSKDIDKLLTQFIEATDELVRLSPIPDRKSLQSEQTFQSTTPIELQNLSIEEKNDQENISFSKLIEEKAQELEAAIKERQELLYSLIETEFDQQRPSPLEKSTSPQTEENTQLSEIIEREIQLSLFETETTLQQLDDLAVENPGSDQTEEKIEVSKGKEKEESPEEENEKTIDSISKQEFSERIAQAYVLYKKNSILSIESGIFGTLTSPYFTTSEKINKLIEYFRTQITKQYEHGALPSESEVVLSHFFSEIYESKRKEYITSLMANKIVILSKETLDKKSVNPVLLSIHNITMETVQELKNLYNYSEFHSLFNIFLPKYNQATAQKGLSSFFRKSNLKLFDEKGSYEDYLLHLFSHSLNELNGHEKKNLSALIRQSFPKIYEYAKQVHTDKRIEQLKIAKQLQPGRK